MLLSRLGQLRGLRKEVMFMDTRLVRDPAEVEQLLSDGYELDSIAYWVDNPVCTYTLTKH